mmetsp:Transcript_10157/g.37805  ORF Transcript_10157/g.37805 Transcript_10157/m.37805 type:complete len:99 (-) Transcript_10157:395-691(-)
MPDIIPKSSGESTSQNLSPDSFPLDAITTTITDKSLTYACRKTSTTVLSSTGAIVGTASGGPIVGSVSGVVLPMVAGDIVAHGIKVGVKQLYKVVSEK